MSGILDIQSFGEHAILVRWEAFISEIVTAEIVQFQKLVTLKFSSEIIETVPTYNELAIYLKPQVTISEFIIKLKALKNKPFSKTSEGAKRLVTIPVCYDSDYSEDIAFVAATNELTEAEVVKIHSETRYTVHFLGFLPGFPYLGGMDERIATPRRETPRTKVPKGAVAVGGKQTGIYSMNSPGGWHIIGRTPLELFSVANNPPTLLMAGDSVQFKQISKEGFLHIENEITRGTYQLKITMHD
jgi:inhibitor of KinA